jgi:hypothetical protein
MAIPGRITIPWRASVGSPRAKNPLNGNNSRIPHSEGSLPHKHNFFKFKHENVIKMKTKPDPALLRPSNLSNEIKKRVPKSRETIPLRMSLSFKLWFFCPNIAIHLMLRPVVLKPPPLFIASCTKTGTKLNRIWNELVLFATNKGPFDFCVLLIALRKKYC